MSVSEWIRTYQSIVGAGLGAILNATISVTVALYISRKVAERGRLNFSLKQIKVEGLWVEQFVGTDKVGTTLTKDFDVADSGRITIYYDLYNTSGIWKLIRNTQIGLVSGKKRRHFEFTEGQVLVYWNAGFVRQLIVDPNGLSDISIKLEITKERMAEIKNGNPPLVFSYKDEKDKVNEVVIGPLIGNKYLRFDYKA